MTAARVERLAEGVSLWPGDNLVALPELAECSHDSCVTDPPYELKFMGKGWDATGVAFKVETWKRILRVLKPGAHLCAFGGTRTFHRMAAAIEDAGFEIRDTVFWCYGSGFPKSMDVSKAIDKAAGAEREVVGQYIAPDGNPRGIDRGIQGGNFANGHADYVAEKMVTRAATDAARQWEGWGTALKPAVEPIILARKPLSESTVAANVLKWGTGALNIDGCRVATGDTTERHNHGGTGNPEQWRTGNGSDFTSGSADGRWPANLIHDGSDEVVSAFPESKSNGCDRVRSTGNVYGEHRASPFDGYHDSGSAARFFYTAKADADDRLGSKHPTVKPLDLMQYLVRLVTPPKGLCLDPFAGTGTTGEACIREGMRAVLIEREAEYQEDIRRRIRLATTAGPAERQREAMKARMKDCPADYGPLFAGSDTPPRIGRQIYGVFADERSDRQD